MSAATTAVPAAAEAARGTRRRAPLSDRRRQEARLGLLLASPAIVVLLAVVGYPILQAVWDSLFNYKLTNPDARSFVGLGNYGLILSDPIWWQALGVTVLITVVTVVVELVLGFALALVMNNALGALRPGLRTAILIPYAIITVVSAFAFRFMWWSVPHDVTSFSTWRERTTVYHEGVPGHHLQIAQAVHERATLNSWRRLASWTSGHGEGWALYAERLMTARVWTNVSR